MRDTLRILSLVSNTGTDGSFLIQPVSRVPNRFGGMRDVAIFRGDIRDLSRKQRREAGISVASGSGNSYF